MISGDKVQIECISYGAPMPSIAIEFPSQVQSQQNKMKIVKKRGHIKLEFIASFVFSGNFTCISKNMLGVRKGWVDIKGRFSNRICLIHYSNKSAHQKLHVVLVVCHFWHSQ